MESLLRYELIFLKQLMMFNASNVMSSFIFFYLLLPRHLYKYLANLHEAII